MLPPPAVLVVCIAFAALISFLYVRETDDLASTGYDVAELRNEASQWKMRNEQLRLTVSQLESLDRVEQVAASRLGLGPPRRVLYVTAPPIQQATPSAAATGARNRSSEATPTPRVGLAPVLP